jgi:hypothetical protein
VATTSSLVRTAPRCAACARGTRAPRVRRCLGDAPRSMAGVLVVMSVGASQVPSQPWRGGCRSVEQREVGIRIERLGPQDACPDQAPLASSSMAITGLKPVCQATAPRPSSRQHLLRVGHLVEEDLARPAVLAADHPRADDRAPDHLVAQPRRVGRDRGEHVARRHLDALDATLSVRSMPSAWIVRSLSMKSAPRAYLKVTRAAASSAARAAPPRARR